MFADSSFPGDQLDVREMGFDSHSEFLSIYSVYSISPRMGGARIAAEGLPLFRASFDVGVS